MAIHIGILDGNNIVTLTTPGKAPIKTSAGLYFYNSNMLLCAAVGACAGKAIVGYCLMRKISTTLLQNIRVDMLDNVITLEIQHASDLEMEPLRILLEGCDISKKICIPIEVKFFHNDKEYIPSPKSDTSTCCGG